MTRRVVLVTLLLALAAPVWAAPRTVTLAVEHMTCSSCPYIVRKALERVPGVDTATVSFKRKTARVTFDDSKARVADLTAATGNAGYPSHAVK